MAAAIVVAAAGTLFYLRFGGAATPLAKSLAVLPLQNLSGDPEQEYFAAGLTEALIGDLAKIKTLRVISRTTAMHYKGAKRPLPEIARELKVDVVVEGSVIRAGDRVQIRAQLIRAANDEHLWAETYDRDLRDIPSLYSEVARTIAHEIGVQLSPSEKARLAAARPVNRKAFEAYLRGRHHWNKRSEESVKQAIAYFRAALEEDPAYAPAYAGLADCYNQLGTNLVGSQPPSVTRPLAIAAASKALEIDGELAEAHAALAFARLYDWNWSGAEQSFRRAIELNPSYAPARTWYASYLVYTGRTAETLREAQRARELDPLSAIVNTQVGWMFALARRLR
ncbi:MAG: tetratricopeptide repeat protein [Acidobacteriota bacterium]